MPEMEVVAEKNLVMLWIFVFRDLKAVNSGFGQTSAYFFWPCIALDVIPLQILSWCLSDIKSYRRNSISCHPALACQALSA